MFEVHGQINKQMVCIHVTLHLMASVQPPSSLRPASFLFLGGWVWCRLTWHGQSLWRAPPACQPPGRSLNQGTERGTSATLRRGERSPRALSPCTAPPPCNPPFINNTPSTPLQTPNPALREASRAEDIILRWQIIQHLYHNDMKISFIGHARHSTCCVVHGVHINI